MSYFCMCHADVQKIFLRVEAYSLTMKHATRITWHSPFDGTLAFHGAQRITRSTAFPFSLSAAAANFPLSPSVGRRGRSRCRQREIATNHADALE